MTNKQLELVLCVVAAIALVAISQAMIARIAVAKFVADSALSKAAAS